MAGYQKRYRPDYRNKRINLTVTTGQFAELKRFARRERLSLPKATTRLAFLGLGRIPSNAFVAAVADRLDRGIRLLRNVS